MKSIEKKFYTTPYIEIEAVVCESVCQITSILGSGTEGLDEEDGDM